MVNSVWIFQNTILYSSIQERGPYNLYGYDSTPTRAKIHQYSQSYITDIIPIVIFLHMDIGSRGEDPQRIRSPGLTQRNLDP